MPTVQSTWREIGLGALLLGLTCGVCAASPAAAISGVVRDGRGVAQMGAVVQVLSSGSASAGTAFTDLYGHYRIANLVPGRYEVRASAAMFLPASRGNLRLATGARATVNLTLTMLSDPAAWLPAERRRPDEPGDDWNWTLRSAANRPILRMSDDGELVLVSASGMEERGSTPLQAHAAVASGDHGFGDAGLHSVLALDQRLGKDSDVVLRTDVAHARPAYGAGPSVEVDAGYQRRMGLAGASRVVVSYASHPEMMSADGTMGLQMVRVVGAQTMRLGDAVDLEAGSTVVAVRTVGQAIAAQPFLRVAVHPGQVWVVRYRMATAREVQGFDGLDSVAARGMRSAALAGVVRTAGDRHQEIAVRRRLGAGSVEAALYSDTFDRSPILGSGVLGSDDRLSAKGSSTVIADTATGAFEFLGPAYGARGLSLTLSEPLTPCVWAALAYQSGAALTARGALVSSLPGVAAALHADAAEAVTVAMKGDVLRSGTRVQASYRWQPKRMLTPVGSYEAFNDQGFLSFYVRQAVRLGNLLPPGIAATMDVTNLLAEGYQPFLSADGRTLFLAEAPRTIQGGLSFTF